MTPQHAPRSSATEAVQGMSSLNPAALSVADAATVLTRLGGKPVEESMIHDDINAGAPTNADGSINLVHYAAWIVRQMNAGGGGAGGTGGAGRGD